MGAKKLPPFPKGPQIYLGASPCQHLYRADPSPECGVHAATAGRRSTCRHPGIKRGSVTLNDASIQDWLDNRSGWKRDGDYIRKTFAFDAFRDSIVFVNRVASLADDHDHHPDIDIRYDKVRIGLSTHDAGGITEKDTKLAEKIDFATSNR